MNSSEVQYFDSDFSFEEHARECITTAQQQQLNKSSSSFYPSSSSQLSCCTDRTAVFAASFSPSGDEEHNRNGFYKDNESINLHPQTQAKFWDAFHTNHSAGKFYKPRRYLLKSFPCIMQYLLDETPSWNDHNMNAVKENQVHKKDKTILLEIGCGSGSSCIPIITKYSEIMRMKPKQCSTDTDSVVKKEEQRPILFLACDSSPTAVETTRRSINSMWMDHAQKSQPSFSFYAFVADPSLTDSDDNDNKEENSHNNYSFLRDVNMACAKMPSSNNGWLAEEGGNIVGIVLLVFVLSAVTPSRVTHFITNVFLITEPGGKVCFRDYGLFDMPMLRFEPSTVCRSAAPYTNDPVFVRGEGTIARFFTVESVREIFESAGFETIELRYCTVFNHNRKTGQKMKRVFVHGVFEKPK